MTRARLGLHVALTALVATAVALAWTLREAVVIEANPVVEPYGAPESGSPRIDAPAPPVDLLLHQARLDPFDPERRVAVRRFTVLDDPNTAATGTAAEPRLIGTALLPGSPGFALCSLPGASARLVRAGETIGGYELEAVRPGEADFRAPDGALVTLTILEPR